MNGNQRVFFSWFYPVDLISAYGWQNFSKAEPAAFYFSPVNCSQYQDILQLGICRLTFFGKQKIDQNLTINSFNQS